MTFSISPCNSVRDFMLLDYRESTSPFTYVGDLKNHQNLLNCVVNMSERCIRCYETNTAYDFENWSYDFLKLVSFPLFTVCGEEGRQMAKCILGVLKNQEQYNDLPIVVLVLRRLFQRYVTLCEANM